MGTLEGGVGKQATAEPAEDMRPKARRKGSGERRDEVRGEGKEASGRNEVKQRIGREKGEANKRSIAELDGTGCWSGWLLSGRASGHCDGAAAMKTVLRQQPRFLAN